MIWFLILVIPPTLFILTVPLSGRLTSALRKVYLGLGGIVVFIGSGISFYFASYTGDQGGIAAYFFQVGVVFVYALLSAIVVSISVVTKLKSRRSER